MRDIRLIKRIALELRDPLRTLILQTNDIISGEELAFKCEEWLRLLELMGKK